LNGEVGLKFHITDDPNFKINKNYIPRDYVDLGAGGKEIMNDTQFTKYLDDLKITLKNKGWTTEEITRQINTENKLRPKEGGLMVTQGIDTWLEPGTLDGNRKYVAIIDTTNLSRSEMTVSTRGFGNELYITSPSKARVIKVVPIKEALKIQKQQQALITSKSQLTDIWNKAQEGGAEVSKKTPVATPEQTELNSRVFERLQAEQPEIVKGDATYAKKNLEVETSKAVDIIATDKQKAFDIAMGSEESAEVLSTSVNIALAEKALEEGNYTLYNTLVKNRSFAQTRRGQEIVAEKGSVSNNDTSQFVKELINSRLADVGKKYTTDIKETFKKSSAQKRGLDKIDAEVKKVKAKVSRNLEIDLAEAQAIIDKLACV
jgi:hypothetical protein